MRCLCCSIRRLRYIPPGTIYCRETIDKFGLRRCMNNCICHPIPCVPVCFSGWSHVMSYGLPGKPPLYRQANKPVGKKFCPLLRAVLLLFPVHKWNICRLYEPGCSDRYPMFPPVQPSKPANDRRDWNRYCVPAAVYRWSGGLFRIQRK